MPGRGATTALRFGTWVAPAVLRQPPPRPLAACAQSAVLALQACFSQLLLCANLPFPIPRPHSTPHFPSSSPEGVARTMLKAGALSMKMEVPKALVAMAPAFAAAPAFASVDVSSMPLSLEVTFAAYLAVLLGTFVPVTFLIVLYSQSEARKQGLQGKA